MEDSHTIMKPHAIMPRPMPRWARWAKIENMSALALKAAISQSRAWLVNRWETCDDIQLLHIKLLRHAELLERAVEVREHDEHTKVGRGRRGRRS